MTVTENNYEEYFLLYVDDELNNVERNAVEAFVQQHPKYAAMLTGLLQAKLSVDDKYVFINKNSLFKNEEKEIGIDNYEDYFLLYTDDELSEKDKESTERFVLQHPQLQAEFTLLQKAKLPLEHIEFKDKEKLYKKDKRVLPLYFTRLAVAAAMVGVMILSWFIIASKKQPVEVIIAKSVEKKQKASSLVQTTVPNTQTIPSTQPIITTKNEQKQTTKSIILSTPKTNEKQKVVDENNDNKIEVAIDNHLSTEPQDVAKPEITQQTNNNTSIAANNKPAETLKPLEEVNVDDTRTQTALQLSSDDNAAKPAVYKELNTDDDNHTLYVGSLQLNKAKVNGILKSASRLLGGKSRQNAD